MGRCLNLNDPRLKRYLDSLEPKYRKMLEDIYKPQKPVQIKEILKRLSKSSRENTELGKGGA